MTLKTNSSEDTVFTSSCLLFPYNQYDYLVLSADPLPKVENEGFNVNSGPFIELLASEN